ncbi:hypothetical protein Lal_00000290 [Lupinus albus]|nr:hypothetical protein Lal_00000290 [Lupinus albus]
MTTGKVVGSIFFAADELLWVEKLAVSTGPDFIDNSWFKIYEDSTWNMLSSTGLTEKVHGSQVKTANSSTNLNFEFGRRGLFLSTLIATTQLPDSRTQLLQKYLKKSEENKEKNDKERLESYYKRNYKDYFESMEGTLNGKDGQLSETEKGIQDWLRRINRHQALYGSFQVDKVGGNKPI